MVVAPRLLSRARMRAAIVWFLVACSATTHPGTSDGDPGCAVTGCPTGETCFSNGACMPGCASNSDCGNGMGCCGNQCKPLDTLSDCGACGNACVAGDFCDGNKCNQPTFPGFCDNKNVYVIHDGITADNTAADVMASTITANCPSTVLHTGDQTDPTLVDQLTGQPLAGSGVTYVLGGGPFPDMPLRWLERMQQVTKIYFDAPDGVNFYWRARKDDSAVATMPGAQCGPHSDQFVTELVTDPTSGTLSLIGYGACSGGAGTRAAAWYYAHVLLPNRAQYPDSWYVFGWTDANGNGVADAADTFGILAHGL